MMRILKLVFCFYFCCIKAQNDVTPVIIWSSINITNNLDRGLTTISDDKFMKEIVFPLLKDHSVIVFLEENLLTKDFQCRFSTNNTSCFQKLQLMENKIFFPQVKHPVDILKTYAEKHQMLINGSLDSNIDCLENSLHLINFTKTSELKRETLLRQHDLFMSKISQLDCNAVYMYMSTKQPNLERIERAIENLEKNETEFDESTIVENDIIDNPVFLFYNEHFAIAFTKIQLLTTYYSGYELEEDFTVLNVVTVAADEGENFEVAMLLDNGAQINFQMKHVGLNAYQINEIFYDNASYKQSALETSIEVPEYFSYSCASVKLPKSKDYELPLGAMSEVLIWHNLQFQHTVESSRTHKQNNTSDSDDDDFDEDNKENEQEIAANVTFKFYDAWSCDGLFTAGSLMGAIILLLTACIFVIGLQVLLNVDSPTRYEDPRLPAFEGGT